MSSAFLRWVGDVGTEELGFDVVRSESAEFTSELTEHAVEKGTPVSDNKIDNPTVCTLEVFCTNTPLPIQDSRMVLGSLAVDVAQYRAPLLSIDGGGIHALPTPGRLIKAGLGAITDAFKVPDTITTYQFPDGATVGPPSIVRYKEQLDQLLDLKSNSTPITIITAAHEYADMQLLRIAPSKTPDDGDGYTFSLEFKSLRTVTTLTIDAPHIAVPVAEKETAKGAQNTKEGGNISLAKKGTNATGITRAGSGRSSAVPVQP